MRACLTKPLFLGLLIGMTVAGPALIILASMYGLSFQVNQETPLDTKLYVFYNWITIACYASMLLGMWIMNLINACRKPK